MVAGFMAALGQSRGILSLILIVVSVAQSTIAHDFSKLSLHLP
jgi:hypothetical protein